MTAPKLNFKSWIWNRTEYVTDVDILVHVTDSRACIWISQDEGVVGGVDPFKHDGPVAPVTSVTCVKFCATFVWDPRCESCRSRRCVQAQRTAPVPAFVSLLCLAAQTLSASPHKFSTCSHILWQISQTRKLQENLTNQNTFKPSTSGQLICPDICHKFCVPRHASVYVCVCPS